MDTTLRLGSKGEQVKEVQKLLNEKLKLNPKLSEDGVFGSGTYIAVQQFQVSKNLGVDGVVGPKTWAVLKGNVAATNHKPAIIVSDAVPWMKFARSEIGQEEISGNKHNAKIIAYHATTTLKATMDETAWCSSFVNWALLQAGIQGTSSAAAISWVNWGKSAGAVNGAIAVIYNSKAANSSLSLSGNHVGFLVQETATHFQLLGGNQGNKVQLSLFPKSSWTLRGYRLPK